MIERIERGEDGYGRPYTWFFVTGSSTKYKVERETLSSKERWSILRGAVNYFKMDDFATRETAEAVASLLASLKEPDDWLTDQ